LFFNQLFIETMMLHCLGKHCRHFQQGSKGPSVNPLDLECADKDVDVVIAAATRVILVSSTTKTTTAFTITT
jgi:hypothetical protein